MLSIIFSKIIEISFDLYTLLSRMSLKSNEIKLFGFDNSEISLIEIYANQHNYNLVSFNHIIEEEIKNKDQNRISLIKINNKNDAKLIKKLHIYFENSTCIFCFNISQRNLFFYYLNHYDFPFFFSPIDINELNRCFVKLSAIKRMLHNFHMHIKGLHNLNLEFRWKSRNIAISPLCSDLASLMALGKYINKNETDGIALALEEAFTNSVEHGNLELESKLRPQTYNDIDEYDKEKTNRMQDPNYGDRIITCRIHTDVSGVSIEIQDQGKGFNTDNYLNQENRLPTRKEILNSSGKGIILIKKYFDTIQYCQNGTCIRLIKKRNS